MSAINQFNPIINIATVSFSAFLIISISLPSVFVAAQPPMPDPELKTAPSPSPDCMELLLNMSDCLRYVEAGSNLTEPDKGCCPELAGLVESNPICLCQLLGGSSGRKRGLRIELKKALELPSVCKVDSPPVSFCEANGIPVGAPIVSEGPSPTSPGDMASEGLAATPSATNDDNGGLSLATTSVHFFANLASAAIVLFAILL